jgi:hypothetical protein
MPLYTYSGNGKLRKEQGCSRSKSSALAALIREHGPLVAKRSVPTGLTVTRTGNPQMRTIYTFSDGVEAVLVAYSGMC